jgi:hypothetical protein
LIVVFAKNGSMMWILVLPSLLCELNHGDGSLRKSQARINSKQFGSPSRYRAFTLRRALVCERSWLLPGNDLRVDHLMRTRMHRSSSIGGEPMNASLAVSDGEIFIRTDKYLWCIGEQRNKTRSPGTP